MEKKNEGERSMVGGVDNWADPHRYYLQKIGTCFTLRYAL